MAITKDLMRVRYGIKRVTYSVNGKKRHPLNPNALESLRKINAYVRGCGWRQGYIAAIIDGEGTVQVGRPRSSPTITVVSTTPELMDWLFEHVGGTVHKRTLHENHLGKKPIYQWTLCGYYVVPRLLQFIVKRMIVKRDKALAILEQGAP